MTYSMLTGGHAPSDLREAFELAIEDLTVTAEEDLDEPLSDLVARIWDLSGQLWNCTDITSCEFATMFNYLDYYQPRGEDLSPSQIVGSFGRAARFIRGVIRHDPNLAPFIPGQKEAA